jgi:hypothetical protein
LIVLIALPAAGQQLLSQSHSAPAGQQLLIVSGQLTQLLHNAFTSAITYISNI